MAINNMHSDKLKTSTEESHSFDDVFYVSKTVFFEDL